MKLCPQCNTKDVNSAVRCDCGYSFPDEPSAPITYREPAVPALKSTPPPLTESSNPRPSVSPEVEDFIHERAYYYVARWHKLDETLKTKTTGTFNWAACLFSGYWMAYRKMYGYAFGFLVTQIVVGFILDALKFPTAASNGLSGGIMVMSGMYGSTLYKRHVLARLAEIPSDLPDHLRRQAIRDMGGTNWWAPWILVALIVGSYLLPLL